MQNETSNNNGRRKISTLHNTYLATTATAAATIFTLTIIFASATTTLVSASTIGNNTTTTTTSVGEEEQEAVSSTATTTTTNNASNALLGRLFSYDEGEDVESNVNPVNETYIVVSYSGNRIILPPNGTSVINATETGNVTINIQPNGLSFNQGHAVIMTEGGAAEEGDGENATITFVLLTRTNPDGSGNGTSVTYFSTNSTGQLAFLDNLVAIGQVEYSPAEGVNSFAEWEWKGGTIPFETNDSSPTIKNQTIITNDVSDAALGNLFMTVEFETASVNPLNETYIEISTLNDVTIMPPNATTGTTINAAETANTTVNILPNGLALSKGQSLLVTEGDDSGAQQENVTTTFVDISRMNPDGSGNGTGIVFFNTNSTGQLAFLDNMVGINQAEFSPEGGTIRTWEWKGGTIPFENLIPQP